MKSLSDRIHQVFTAALTAAVIGAFTLVVEVHTKIALLDKEIQDSNQMSAQILQEINRIHPRQ